MGHRVPERVTLADGERPSATHLLLDRAGFGPWPGETDRVETMGAEAWLDEQLEPERLNDFACDLRARGFESLHLPPGDAFEFKRPVILEELARATLLRAVYSKRRLLEVMVGFWSDHFNVDTGKGDVAWLKTSEDRDVIRKHALGNFRDLVRASALSPAMLVYLDGTRNRVGRPGEKPNENYARELMELHTLGVDGGYTQDDVMEAARALTGWHVRDGGWRRGAVEFDGERHDDGRKTVLGQVIPAGGGERDLDLLLEILCAHPAAARYVAHRLCRRLVSEDPPASLVDRAARAFRDADFAIPALLRTILLSEEFRNSGGERLKRPFHFVVSALRAVAADTHAPRGLLDYLGRMGQAPFQYPTPDGYPLEPAPWRGTLLWRWNFALSLMTQRLPGTRTNVGALVRATGGKGVILCAADLAPLLLGRRATEAERRAVLSHAPGGPEDEPHRFAEGLGLLLASPGFQRS
jgi:hypothetical protein